MAAAFAAALLAACTTTTTTTTLTPPGATVTAPSTSPAPTAATPAGPKGPLTILSAGAVEPGMRAVVAAFERNSGLQVALTFAAAPQLRQRLAEGSTNAEIVIAPRAVLDEHAAAQRSAAPGPPRVTIGSVGVGVAVREGAPLPDVSSLAALQRALLAADRVVYNRASTGEYVDAMLQRLGLAGALQQKTLRVADGAAVMQALRAGNGRDIGLGALTEIALYRGQGVALAGPLPPEVQNATLYQAVPTGVGLPSEAAVLFLGQLGGAQSQALIRAAGIETLR